MSVASADKRREMITGIVNRDFDLIIPLSVDEADSEPLLGMSLMNGYQLVVQVFPGGLVELSKVTPV